MSRKQENVKDVTFVKDSNLSKKNQKNSNVLVLGVFQLGIIICITLGLIAFVTLLSSQSSPVHSSSIVSSSDRGIDVVGSDQSDKLQAVNVRYGSSNPNAKVETYDDAEKRLKEITVVPSREKDSDRNFEIEDVHKDDLSGALTSPVDSFVPTSGFGQRANPAGEGTDFHTGLDLAGQCGTDVRAAASGTVVLAGWHSNGGGNRIEIDHGNGLVTSYNHLESLGVQEGDKVSRGEVISPIGSTGASTGCHLHFEVIANGENVDPAPWL